MLADDVILSVSGLRVQFRSEGGLVRSVDGVDFSVGRGETLAIVGESGSGKSITCLSLIRLVDKPGEIAGGTAQFQRKDGAVIDLVSAPESVMRRVRGDDIAMIFQEPMTSLNPLYTVEEQIGEVSRQHRGVSRRQARDEAVAMLREVGIADPERRAGQYPHELSGGMRQRVMIAMALTCRPALLIADEPTTALDVTIQAQILTLLSEVRARNEAGMGIIFVTHNMGIVAEIADRVIVMYAGLVVESGPVAEMLRAPRHPYTMGLLASIVRITPRGLGAHGRREKLAAIPGNVPDPLDRPQGCPFAPRCTYAEPACCAAVPALETVDATRQSRCRRWAEL